MEIRFGSAFVKLSERKDGRVSMWWREEGKRKNSTVKSLELAKSKAREIAKRLDAGDSSVLVPSYEAGALALLKEDLGKRSLLDVCRLVGAILKSPKALSLLDETSLKVSTQEGSDSKIAEAWRKCKGEHVEEGRSPESIRSMREEMGALLKGYSEMRLSELNIEFLTQFISRGKYKFKPLINDCPFGRISLIERKRGESYPHQKKQPLS